MRSLSVRLLLSFLILIAVPTAFAHDVTITGTQNFASLDGSSSDHDGAVNGVFTVNDGNLAVNGVVNCNDDVAASACSMSFNVSGNMSVNAGGALYSENRSGGGTGGAITLTVGGNLALNGNAVVSTASKSSSGATGGAITANVSGSVSLASGTTIDSGSANAAGGAIVIAAGGTVSVDGNVLSGPSRTFLATRLSGGAALDGGTSNNVGGAITITSATFAEPAVLIGSTANIVSQGADNGAGPVTIDGCGIQVHGLVAALSRKAGAAAVSIRSGKDVLIDGRDLGASGTRMGRIRADAPSGTALNKGVDIFATETIDIYGPASGLYVITSLPGLHDSKSYGGRIRITSLADAVNGSGNLIDDGHTASGDTGGAVEISAKEDVNLNTAVIRAHGDFNTGNNNRGGGSIHVRSYSGDVIWTNGTGDVRPVGSTSGLPLADQGSIVLTACGTVDTTGSSFPVNGTATSVFPETHTGVCSPAAPSLPSGVPPLVTCNTPPVANDASATTDEDTTVTITLSGSDADGDALTFSIVSGPANGVLGPIVPTGPTTATVDYTPNLNYNGGDSFVFQADDGNGGTDNATVTITVNAVNDPPSFLAGPTVTVLEDSGAQSYPNWASSISAGPADESGQTVTFTVTNDNPSLFSVPPAVDSNGTLTFTPAANAFGSAELTIVAQDSGGTANGGDDTSDPQTSDITITPVNDEPSFVSGGDVTVNEDSGAYSAAWATSISAGPANESGQTLTFNVTGNTDPSLFASGPSVSSTGVLSFTLAANASGSADITVTLSDDGGTANGGDDTSDPETFTITVNSANDAPSFVSGGDVMVNEDSGAYSAAWATSISAGPANESGQTVTFNIIGNTDPSLFASGPSISSTGVLSFTLAADAFGSADITVTLSDDGGTANGGDDTSDPETFTITVNAVNDAPSFVAGGDVTVNEDSGAYSAAWATSISAGPANESGQTVAFNTSNDNNALFSVQPSLSSTGVLTFTPAPNAFGFATVTVSLQDNGGTANGGVDTSGSVTFEIHVNAVNDPPVAGNDAWETEGNTELRVDLGAGTTPHVADTTPSGNGVAHNDSDPVEGDPVVITGVVGCADVTAPFDCTVTGGTVSLNANGSFSFQPASGIGAGSFQYTVTDGTDTATGTVTITVHDRIWYVNGSAPAGGDGTSNNPFNDFSSLNGISDVDVAGDYIFVHSSNVNGSIDLEPSQKLWGQGVGLIIPRNLNGNGFPTVIVAAGARPNVGSTGDTVTVNGVTGVEIAGLNLASSTANAIDVTSPSGGAAASATIYSNEVLSAGQEGIDINASSAAGTAVSINGTSVTSTGNGVDLFADAGTVIFSFSNGTIHSVSGSGLVADGSAADTLIINGLSNVTISGNTAGNGVSITAARFDANAGTAAFETLSGGALNVGASGNPVGAAAVTLSNVSGDLAFGSINAYGSTSGVTIAGSGLYTGAAGMRVTNGGGAVSAAAGVGLSVSNTTIGAANLSFTSISATGGANGILLNNTGTSGGLVVSGTGSAGSGGTIQNTSSDAVRLANAANVSLAWMNLTNSASGSTNAVTCNLSNASGCEAAVDMNTVTNVSLANVVIDHNNAGQAGISGVAVNGLSVTNSQILEVGDADAESAVLLHNPSGTVLLQDVMIEAPEEYGVRVYQTAGSLSMTLRRVTVQNNIGTFGEAGASWRVEGGTATVLVDDSDFLNTDGPAVDGQAVLAGALNLTLTGNTMNENRALPHGVNFVTAGTGTGRLSATGNTLAGCAVAANCSQGFDLDATNTSALDATIVNNVITNPGIGTGIEFIVNDNAFGRAEIRDNNITVNPNRIGMNFLARAVAIPGATGQLHLTVANNVVNGINSSFIPGFQLAAGASTGTHATTVCANVSTLNGSGNNVGNGTPGPDVYAFTLRQRTGTTFQLQGFTGTGTLPSAVEAFVQSNNSGGTLAGATEVFAAAGSTIVNYSNGTCQTPSAPPLP